MPRTLGITGADRRSPSDSDPSITMQKLSSYVQGRWQEGSGKPALLHDPSNGEVVAECSTEGIDMKAACEYARSVGGPALRALSFAERAKILKDLAAAIHEYREELIDLSILNAGSTRGDAKFDIDGATGTLAAYASYGKRLDSEGFLPDGEGLQLGRTARFWGQHILTPKRGLGLHINAFNFPAWGMMEKFACSFLAGVPAIEKPGTPTALIAWRVAQICVESKLLPEGSFQFVCGSAGDLLDHLDSQDVMAFTGSSGTGTKLRAHPNVVAKAVSVNIEADSLNAAVLAPDVDAGDDAYGLFLRNVVQDATQKTGQKCTAVRRVLVPADRIDEIRTDLAADLGRIKLGLPGEKDTRMGPVASKAQLDDVRAGIERLSKVGEIACGGAGAVEGFEQGCFVAPTLIVVNSGSAESRNAVHQDEVFGPVLCLLPYDGSSDEAARFIAEGGGGLVASAYSNDADWIEGFVLGAAPFAGRLWIGSAKSAEQSLPPGMVLPGLIHGGPGRAGGGEELGGLRGLEHYMQRTALQGYKGIIANRFGAKSIQVAEEAASPAK